MRKNNWLKLVISLALPLLVGGISGSFTATEVKNWYLTLQKPSWNPPSAIFAPVWTTLYLLMGYAFYRVWTKPGYSNMKNTALGLFVTQLVLNFFWSFIFFKQHQLGWAFLEIVAMWLAILFTIIAFSKIDKIAAWLLVPYISWVSFAAILNNTIWQLNLGAK
jgi:translocator protein